MKLLMENWRSYLKEEEGELRTVGDLRRAVAGATKAKQSGRGKDAIKDVAVGMVLDAIPGAGTAKSLWDIAKSMYKMPDDKKTNTGLDFLNVDDEISAIVDDNVENAFLKALGGELKGYPDETELEQMNVTKMLTKYIAGEFDNRVVAEPQG
tara:strand:+ start:265 stop:720 length:456 start_codon:yes stop_codon:yes gene_type:complete